MTPADKIQAMINGRLHEIDQLEAELNILRELQDEFRGSNGVSKGGGGRKPDGERHAKLLAVLRNPEGVAIAWMSEVSGYGLSSMKTKIKKMFKAGEVERVSPGRYRLKSE